MSSNHDNQHDRPGHPKGRKIFIDKRRYRAPKELMTGAELRALADPPVGPDRDLWLDVVDALDDLVGDETVIDLDRCDRFFTVPKLITPGTR